MEIDREIAFMQQAYQASELKEQREKEYEKYDLKRKIKYSLPELEEGIKSGKQFLYALKIEFIMKEVLDGNLQIPYMLDFFDVIDDKPENLFLVSSKRKVSMVATVIPNVQLRTMEDWMSTLKESVKKLNLYATMGAPQVVNQMEYFSYEVPTSEGVTYNLMFRYPKNEKIYSGSFNCMIEEKEGMGLLLEAMIRMIESFNR